MCACVSLICALGQAQMNVAVITGVLQDVSGEAIAHAAVSAVNAETRVKFAAATDNSGHFQLPELAPGSWSLAVSADGFQQAAEQVPLHAWERLTRNFTLSVGPFNQVVIVEGAPGQLQTQSAELKDVIENQQVVNLPVRDREFLELAMLGPGLANPPGGTRGDSLQQTGKLINILFLVDGVSVTDEYYNNVVLSP
jgi:hypothetical protein